ncbi:MAG: hypothetical protein AB7G47_10560 [Mycolicibacterium sp.]
MVRIIRRTALAALGASAALGIGYARRGHPLPIRLVDNGTRGPQQT